VTAGQEEQLSEAQIAVHWREEAYWQPPAKFIAQANAADPAIFDRFSEEHFPDCFKEYADLLGWDAYWHTVLDTSNPPFWRWFVGGRLNASYNCVDRHMASTPNRAALIWVPEPETEDTEAITYRELYRRVNEFAAVLHGYCGLNSGDRVTFPSCRCPCSPAPASASSTPRCSVASAAPRAGIASPIRAAASWSRWTATTATAS
jgi:acetyl-CoA synthetase